MDVIYILLGCPWLYDHDVVNHGREYIFLLSPEQNIVLCRDEANQPPAKVTCLAPNQFVKGNVEADIIDCYF